MIPPKKLDIFIRTSRNMGYRDYIFGDLSIILSRTRSRIAYSFGSVGGSLAVPCESNYKAINFEVQFW